jgi:ribonuclease HII
MILGIDEVGRGCWAGPLVVGAVVLGDVKIDGLTDSKALSKKRREELNTAIQASGAGIGLGWVSAVEIDDIGLSEALRLATRRAVQEVQKTGVPFHEIIIDGTVNFLTETPLESYVSTLKKADLLIASVSAASIVAKVARDNYMSEQAKNYPEFGFEKHVGYGTAAHSKAIDDYGVVPLHRLSFAPMAKYRKENKGVESKSANQTTRAIGDASETTTAEYLQTQGYEILDRNWKTKICEIDIVAKRDNIYFFVEVKHRKNDTSGDGLAAITPKKLAQMKKAAELYALKHKLVSVDLRLMAIATFGEPPQIGEIIQID